MKHLSDPHIKESTKRKAPAYTFGGRFKSSSDKVSPSPNSYNTTGLTNKGDKYIARTFYHYFQCRFQ